MSTGPAARALLQAGDFRRFALELSRAATPAEVVAVVSRHGCPLFGASRAAIALPSTQAGFLDLVAGDHERVRQPWARFAVDADTPLAAAFRTGRIQVHDDSDALLRDFPTAQRCVGTDPVSSTRGSLASPLHSGERIVGALVFGFDEPQSFGSAELELLDAVAGLSAIVLERARLYAESKQDAEHQRFLARASELLGSSLDLDETLQTVAALAVPGFADWVAIDLFEDDGSVRRVAVHHADPARLAFARDCFRGYPTTPEEVEAFRVGGPRMVSDVTDEMLVETARDPEQLALNRALGPRSWIAAPILARDQVYGSLTFVQAESGRRYTEQDLAVAADLARRAGVALENALLYEGVRTAEREVAQAQRMFARIADATPDVLLVAELPSGRNIYVNRDMSKILGHTTEEVRLLGRSVLRTIVHPEDLDRVVGDLKRVPDLEDGELIEHGYRVRHADGSWRWLDVRSVVFARDDDGRPSQLLSVARDVTAERMQGVALARSEERYRLATYAVGGMVYEVDVAADRITQSPGLGPLLGFEPTEETSGTSWWWSRIHPDDSHRKALAISEALRTGSDLMESEYRLLHRDGTFRWVWDRARLECNPHGDLIRLVGCATDITDRVNATQALEDADRRKEDFLALVGHELRNPLAAVRNAADVLARTSPGHPTFGQAREVIVRQVGHMGRMLEDLLDLSRMTKDKLQVRPEPLDVVALVHESVEEQRPEFEHAGIAVALRGGSDPTFVLGDPTRLSQVLAIVLNNAAKFTDPGGNVVVEVSAADDRVTITISDSGVGIAPEKLAQLFSPFVQGERRLDSSTGGLGLGLALVKGLVELHGGEVHASSGGSGCGATFAITLPQIEAPPEAAAPREMDRSHRRILIVEDNEDAAAMLKMLLEFGGHTVELAIDGAGALERARSFAPDVVLCDIGLPGAMDGYGVARALRAEERDGRLFLIALTGYGQVEDQRRAMDAGFDRHVTKPIDPAELELLIAEGP